MVGWKLTLNLLTANPPVHSILMSPESSNYGTEPAMLTVPRQGGIPCTTPSAPPCLLSDFTWCWSSPLGKLLVSLIHKWGDPAWKSEPGPPTSHGLACGAPGTQTLSTHEDQADLSQSLAFVGYLHKFGHIDIGHTFLNNFLRVDLFLLLNKYL